jgi:integrase
LWLAIGWPALAVTRISEGFPVLTIRQIEAAKPQAARYVLWDGRQAGFGLRVAPTGRKTFILSYRLRGTRRAITASLGTYGDVTLDQARNEARKLAGTVAHGGDPQATKRARAAAERALTAGRLVELYAAALKSGTASSKRLHGRPASVGYVEDTLAYLALFARTYGKRAAAAVSRRDIEQLMAGYAGRPATQRNLHGAISRLYIWARRQDLVRENPAADIETTRAASRERVLSLDELARVWHAAGELNDRQRDIVRLLMLTGQRRAEVAGMTWGEVNLATAVWTLPASRTKARRQHSVPLPSLAMELLLARYKEVHQPDELIVASSYRSAHEPFGNWYPTKCELDRLSGITGWRLHDLRRSIVSICAEHGADVAVLDTLLNHSASVTRGGVIGVYQRATLLGPMRNVMQLWDRLLREAIDSALAEQKVVSLAESRH